MKPGERVRVRMLFGLLGAVPVFLAGWLGWVQVAQAGSLSRGERAPLRLVPQTADGQYERSEALPAPRGTIVDRRGRPLAMDREVYEVRAVVTVPQRNTKERQVDYMLEFLGRVANGLATALASDPELADRGVARERQLQILAKRFDKAFRTEDLSPGGEVPKQHVVSADIPIAREVDALDVIEALRRLDADRHLGDWIRIDFLRVQHRTYSEHDVTYGLVGQLFSRTVQTETGPKVVDLTNGLESLTALVPGDDLLRSYRKDGGGHAYFLAPLAGVLKPNVLHTTIDLDLQRLATRELAAEAARAGENGNKEPLWAAMVVVEIASGDVLAAASWHRGAKSSIGLSCTPYQSLYEPGSIVKPLVLAYALELGAIDWNHAYNCSPQSSTYRDTIAHLGRSAPVRDDHACYDLTPHGILVNSSNIGACYIGLTLERDRWRDYMAFYGFGESLGLPLPNEPGMSVATHARHSFHRSFDPATPPRRFRANSAISFSFGYEFQVTAMQMARAYLRMFRGDAAELRLCRGVEQGGEWLAAPAAIGAGRRLRPEVVHAVQNAMIDVVSETPGATGNLLVKKMRKELGIDLHGVVAGKTGTAVSNVYVKDHGKHEARNASFVGFLPAESPKWLAVCVLQRDDDAKFYGGSYAAPPVVRVLLRADQLTRYRQPNQDSQGTDRGSSVIPGDSGWSRGAPEKSVQGR